MGRKRVHIAEKDSASQMRETLGISEKNRRETREMIDKVLKGKGMTICPT